MKGIKFSLIDYVWMVHVVYIFLYGSDKVKSADMLSYDFRSHICDENMRCRNVNHATKMNMEFPPRNVVSTMSLKEVISKIIGDAFVGVWSVSIAGDIFLDLYTSLELLL